MVHLKVSPHARGSAQLRGVREYGIELAALYGEPLPQGDGRIIRHLTVNAVKKMTKSVALTPAELDHLYGVNVVTEDVGNKRIVITVLPKEKMGGPRRLRRRERAHVLNQSNKRQSMRSVPLPA